MRTGAVLRAALEASCLRGALPPVDLRAVCLVRAMASGGRAKDEGVEKRRVAAAGEPCDGGKEKALIAFNKSRRALIYPRRVTRD